MFENFVSITEANQNFSKVARLCNDLGEVFILKNNKALFKITSLTDENSEIKLTDDEKLEVASRRIINKYHKAYEELAK